MTFDLKWQPAVTLGSESDWKGKGKLVPRILINPNSLNSMCVFCEKEEKNK